MKGLTTASFRLKTFNDNPYVSDGSFKPDNNDIEEVIRPLEVGLNNYGYCHNHDAAYRAAKIYSFIVTCNKADVNPREWMVDVMPQI